MGLKMEAGFTFPRTGPVLKVRGYNDVTISLWSATIDLISTAKMPGVRTT